MGLILRKTETGIQVEESLAGGAAQLSGVEDGAVLLVADGQSLDTKSLEEAVALLRGPEGSAVRLRWRTADGAEVERSLRRQKLTPPAVAHAVGDWVYLRPRSDSGGRLQRQVLAALAPLQRELRHGLVLDLRQHGGGPAQEMADLAALFLPQDDVRMHIFAPGDLSTVEGEAADRRFNDRGAAQRPQPGALLVLMDQGTSNGAAWLADALHRHAGARLVGAPSNADFRTYKALPVGNDGARFEIPHGELLSIDGLPLQGHSVMPGLRDTTIGPARTSRAPHGLAQWLSAQVLHAAPTASAPTLGVLPTRLREAGLCIGLSLIEPPQQLDLQLWRGRVHLNSSKGTGFEWAVGLASDEPHPLMQKLMLEREELDAQLAALESQLKRAPHSAAAGLCKQHSAKQAERNALRITPVRHMQLIQIDEERHGLIWDSDSERHSLYVRSDSPLPTAELLAAYRQLAAGVSLRSDRLEKPSSLNACLGSWELRQPLPPEDVEWQALWAPRDPVAAQRLNLQLQTAGAMRSSPGDAPPPIKREIPLLAGPDACHSKSPQGIERKLMFGATGLMMSWETPPERLGCQAVRISLPWTQDIAGRQWTFHLSLGGSSGPNFPSLGLQRWAGSPDFLNLIAPVKASSAGNSKP
ncbi:S41 family peptidase [Inhella proteolytica]|uniref:PDZ domain-containing protein n=1 Tax=Inhella proteolytica TaxID=2795029 RepID=A0A931NHF8_9BURK|nr:S41 family peptidase [Inhella proteolytica]MBH9577698.1 hypothetical protein [Inhella proteolytica]